MNDEIKKALAAARVKPLADTFGGRSSVEAALAASDSGALLKAVAAQAADAPFASLIAVAAQAQRFTAADVQLRKMSELISARSREPYMIEFRANADRMSSMASTFAESSIAKQLAESLREADSGLAKMLSSAQTEISGSSHVLRTIERFRECFASKATLSSSFTRALEELHHSSRVSLSATDPSISSFVAMHEAAARSVSRIAAGARSFDQQAIERLTKSFDHVGKLALMRDLPGSLVSIFAEASKSAKYLDSIRLPLIDSASAAAIARFWGEEGVNRQLRALGIEAGARGLVEGHETVKPDQRIEVLPILRDAITLLSLLFALYQWWDSQQTEARIIGTIREDRAQREKQLEAVKALISATLTQQA